MVFWPVATTPSDMDRPAMSLDVWMEMQDHCRWQLLRWSAIEPYSSPKWICNTKLMILYWILAPATTHTYIFHECLHRRRTAVTRSTALLIILRVHTNRTVRTLATATGYSMIVWLELTATRDNFEHIRGQGGGLRLLITTIDHGHCRW